MSARRDESFGYQLLVRASLAEQAELRRKVAQVLHALTTNPWNREHLLQEALMNALLIASVAKRIKVRP